ncbi:hypothetical protein DPMN_037200 [Dreissena polymorpha]|uniref:Uncharacterized protein n=1 Tax=Dreissena polymorpha TaxID=45954 RepID=A0A9D4RML1_DREPO|nr:hypothetical protein DPMN_037200 [Dreissena polymorpha]
MSSTRGCSVSRPGAPDCLTQGPRLLYLQEILYSQVPQIQLSHNILIEALYSQVQAQLQHNQYVSIEDTRPENLAECDCAIRDP